MSALHRVLDGEIDYPAREWVEVDRLVSKLVSQGRITRRANDGCSDRYTRVYVALVQHPICDPGEVVALYWMGAANPSRAYICTESDAIEALGDPGAFNL